MPDAICAAAWSGSGLRDVAESKRMRSAMVRSSAMIVSNLEGELPALSAQRLPDQQHVQPDDEPRGKERQGRRQAVVDERAHQRAVSGEKDQRDHRQWKLEAEADLTQDEDVQRIQPEADDGQGRKERDRAAKPHVDPGV